MYLKYFEDFAKHLEDICRSFKHVSNNFIDVCGIDFVKGKKLTALFQRFRLGVKPFRTSGLSIKIVITYLPTTAIIIKSPVVEVTPRSEVEREGEEFGFAIIDLSTFDITGHGGVRKVDATTFKYFEGVCGSWTSLAGSVSSFEKLINVLTKLTTLETVNKLINNITLLKEFVNTVRKELGSEVENIDFGKVEFWNFVQLDALNIDYQSLMSKLDVFKLLNVREVVTFLINYVLLNML